MNIACINHFHLNSLSVITHIPFSSNSLDHKRSQINFTARWDITTRENIVPTLDLTYTHSGLTFWPPLVDWLLWGKSNFGAAAGELCWVFVKTYWRLVILEFTLCKFTIPVHVFIKTKRIVKFTNSDYFNITICNLKGNEFGLPNRLPKTL